MVLLGTFLMTGITRRRSLASRVAGAETTATVEEGMSNVVAVQGLGASRRQRAAFAADSRESFKRFRAYILMIMLLIVVQSVVTVSLVFYVFFDICEAVIVGRMSPGDFSVVYAYFVQLVTNLSGLGSMWFNLQNNVAGMRRVYDVVDAPVDADLQGNDAIERVRRSVEVDNVVYRYPDGTQAVREASLEARIGEVVALVGATGAGKSTLAYLLAGFVQPQAGSVRLDGVDARTLSVDCLRAQVAFVFQEAFLFDDTVENNIRMSAPEATHDEVVEAARVAGALGFIQALPQGFATRLGRMGGTLSVGQKQRLAIARGLVSKSPVLVLDEPTASPDPETENALVAALVGRSSRPVAGCHRAPAEHHTARRPDLFHGRGTYRRVRQPRRVDGLAERRLSDVRGTAGGCGGVSDDLTVPHRERPRPRRAQRTTD